MNRRNLPEVQNPVASKKSKERRRRGTCRTPRRRRQWCRSGSPGTASSRREIPTAAPAIRAGKRTVRRPAASSPPARRSRAPPVMVRKPVTSQAPISSAGEFDLARNFGRHNKDARADHRAHDQHGGAGQAQSFTNSLSPLRRGKLSSFQCSIGLLGMPRGVFGSNLHQKRRNSSAVSRRTQQVRDDRHRIRTRLDNLSRHCARVIPPIATSGLLVSARALRTPSSPTNAVRILLAGRRKHRPDRNVVRRARVRFFDLCRVVRRDTRQCARPPPASRPPPEDRPAQRARRRNPHGHAEVGAIIHDQLDLPWSTRLISRACASIWRVSPSLLRYCSKVTPPSARSRANSTIEFTVRNCGAKQVTSRIAYSLGNVKCLRHIGLLLCGLFIDCPAPGTVP